MKKEKKQAKRIVALLCALAMVVSGFMTGNSGVVKAGAANPVTKEWSIVSEATTLPSTGQWEKTLDLNLNKTAADAEDLVMYVTFTLSQAVYDRLSPGVRLGIGIGQQADSAEYQWYNQGYPASDMKVGENTLALSFADANVSNADLGAALTKLRVYVLDSTWLATIDLSGMVINEMKIVDVSPYVQEYASGEAGKTPEELGLSTENVPEGYLFAGWYKDAECTTENTLTGKSNSTVYAKFVRQDVLDLKAQYVTEKVAKGSEEWPILSGSTVVGETVTWTMDPDVDLDKTAADANNLVLHVTFTINQTMYDMMKGGTRLAVGIGQTADSDEYLWYLDNYLGNELQVGENSLALNFAKANTQSADLSAALTEMRIFYLDANWAPAIMTGITINQIKVVYTPSDKVEWPVVSSSTAVGETITWTQACNIDMDKTAADAADIVLHLTFNVTEAAYNNMKPGVRLGIGIGQTADTKEYLWNLDSYLANELQLGDNTLELTFASANTQSADLSAALTTVRMFYWTAGWEGVGNLNGVTIKEMKVVYAPVKGMHSIVSGDTAIGETQTWVKSGLALDLDKTSADESNLILHVKFTLTGAAYNNLKDSSSLRIEIGQTDANSYGWYFQPASTVLQEGENTLALSFAEANSKNADLSEALNQVRIYCWASDWSGLLNLNGLVINEMKIEDKAAAEGDYDQFAAIRFITTVDSKHYQSVGFDIEINNVTKAKTSAIVYQTLYALDSTGQTLNYKPTDIDAASWRFSTFTVDNIPEEGWGTSITVRPFWYTQDGTKVAGEAKTYTINGMMN